MSGGPADGVPGDVERGGRGHLGAAVAAGQGRRAADGGARRELAAGPGAAGEAGAGRGPGRPHGSGRVLPGVTLSCDAGEGGQLRVGGRGGRPLRTRRGGPVGRVWRASPDGVLGAVHGIGGAGNRAAGAGRGGRERTSAPRGPDRGDLTVGVVGQQAGGQLDGDGDAAAWRVVQLDRDVVAGGEVAGHVVAQVLRRGDGERLDTGEASVGRRDVQGGHPQARVDDGERVAATRRRIVAGAAQAADLDDLVGGREHQCVLDELGEQVGQVGGRGTDHRGRLEATDDDALVVLDLAERGADDVGHPHGGGPLAGWLDARQHQQRLGVAAHAGGEVVEAEQAGQGVGVGLPRLELGDEVELAAEQVLVAATQVHEAVGDVAAQHRLLHGEIERRVLHRVQRIRHVGDLVTGRDPHRRHRRHDDVVSQRCLQDLGDGTRQPPIGHLLGLARSAIATGA